jgi:hypothetical protein
MSLAETSKSPREKRITRSIATAVTLLALYTLLVIGSLFQPWLIVPAIVAALASVIAAVFWMRALDEAKQQAHYVAWYWGGSAGLTFSMLGFLALLPLMLQPDAFQRAFTLAPELPPGTLIFLAGFSLGAFPAGIGYLIWWAAIWARR